MYYSLTPSQLEKELATDISQGLSSQEILRRQKKYGLNALTPPKQTSFFLRFFSQFKSFLVIILIIATLISFFLGETIDAVVILFIIILNAALGFVQGEKAAQTLNSLRNMDIVYAKTLRSGQIEKIPSEELVPGDIIFLEEGDKVPADIRLLETFTFKADESIITGESIPVEKNFRALPPKQIAIGEQSNMLFRDTQVVLGRAKGVVVATGSRTQIGQIASFLTTEKGSDTPLKKELDHVGKMLTILILIIALIIFVMSLLKHTPVIEGLLLSISLSVAAIPEGLPAISTIIMSLGVKRLADKKALVKKLDAVETLGAIRMIATDKTGTLTENKMSVTDIILADGSAYQVSGTGYQPEGKFTNHSGNLVNPNTDTNLHLLLLIGIVANHAAYKLTNSQPEIIGDPTEGSLLVSALRAGLNLEETKQNYPVVFTVPFSSERKVMSVIVKMDGTDDYFLYTKGAPEIILGKSRYFHQTKPFLIKGNFRRQTLNHINRLSENGLRTLSMAYRRLTTSEVKKALEEDSLSEDNLIFVGTVGQKDPLHDRIKETLLIAREAGIRTMMITGDHLATATAVALEAGLIHSRAEALSEEQIINLSEKELTKILREGKISVFARVGPFGKLKIIEAAQKIPGNLLAVTGDGVNDAPALKAADIGVAMGQNGTDVAREVADIILIDDNYTTIINAIEEGRVIFANLVKVLRYLLSCNLSEVILITLAIFSQLPAPLIPIQILWINLITDGLPAVALGLDPTDPDSMKKPPRLTSEGILNRPKWTRIIAEGSFIGLINFFFFLYALNTWGIVMAQTVTFATVAITQLVHSFNNRSHQKSVFHLGLWSNPYLILAGFFSILLQILITQTPWGNLIFKTTGLNLVKWLLILLISITPLFLVETKKWAKQYLKI